MQPQRGKVDLWIVTCILRGMDETDHEQDIRCDGEGCENRFFIASSCLLQTKHVDAVAAALGWTFQGETEAYCPHCKPQPSPRPTPKPLKKGG